MSAGGATADAQHCFDLVRQGDKDRFLASLFAPDAKRAHLLALYAFNIEIARVRDIVSQPQLGEIRLQWWRDALEAIYASEAPAHPVVQELARAVEAGGLPREPLLHMVDARQFDLYDDPMPTMGDLEGYHGETASALIQLAALLLAGPEARSGAEAAGLAGVAQGIAGLMRSLPLHRSRGQCYVPTSLLEQHGATRGQLIAGCDAAGLAPALAALRQSAESRLAEARAAANLVPRVAMPAFFPAGLSQLYLARLAKLGVRCLTEVADVAQWRRQLWLYRRARVNTF